MLFNRKLVKTKARGWIFDETFREIFKKWAWNFLQNNIRFKAIGDLSKFSKSLQNTIKEIERKTSNNSGLTQVLALNYGSKDEILRAIRKIKWKKSWNKWKNFESCLDTAGFSEVDLLIRTSGEIRLSNYLLWQNAYAEMFLHLLCGLILAQMN